MFLSIMMGVFMRVFSMFTSLLVFMRMVIQSMILVVIVVIPLGRIGRIRVTIVVSIVIIIPTIVIIPITIEDMTSGRQDSQFIQRDLCSEEIGDSCTSSCLIGL